MAGPVVGLDIGTQQMKVVEVSPGRGGRLAVTALGVAPTPAGVMQNNIITDPKLMGQAVRQLLRESGVRAKKVVGSVAGQSAVVIRIIEVPKMTDAELKETMKWEVERHVPFAPSETIMDYRPLAPLDPQSENNPNMEVLLAVAQQDIIANYVDMVFAAGLDPLAIDIEPLAGARALLDVVDGQPVVRPQPSLAPSPAPAGDEFYDMTLHDTVAIVNIGASNTDISIFQDGQLAFPRSLPLGGDSLTRAIGEMLGYAPDQAERVKRELGAVQLDKMAVYTGTAYEDNSYDAPGFDDAAPDFVVSSIPDDDATAFSNPFETAPDESSPGDLAFQPTSEGAQFDELERTQPIPQRTLNLARKPDNEGYLSSDPDTPADPGLAMGTGGADTAALRDQIFDAIAPVLGELATELRRSLDYYRSRAQGRSVDRVILTGGSASLTNFAPFLQNELQVPVLVGDPLTGLEVVAKNYDQTYLRSIAPIFTVAVGLAARDSVFAANPVAKPPKPAKTVAKTKVATGQPVNVTSPPTS